MLKGKTVIELTNVKTGQVERFEDENLVTNAVQDYLNAYLLLKGFSGSITKTVYEYLLGGVKLFENSIEEDANNYTIPSVAQNKIIGYASIEAKTNADARRGNLNLQETTEVDNGMQLVWDFATSEANGTISCVCLTSDIGGKSSQAMYASNGVSFGSFSNIIGYDKTEQRYYSGDGNNNVQKFKLDPYNVKISNKFMGKENVEEIAYTAAVITASGIRVADSNRLYYSDASRRSGFGTVIYTRHTGEKISEISINLNSKGIYVTDQKGIVVNEYWYLVKSDTEIYKINLKDTSDITLLEFQGAKLNLYNICVLENGDIACGNCAFDPTTGEYDICFDTNGSLQYYSEKCFALNNNYIYLNGRTLMTINNLQTPVTKTADKTMKITYTLLYSE